MTVGPPNPELIVVSDLDGSLLDHETYLYEEAREALQALWTRRVPLVLCSSKTRREMEPLARALAPGNPFIVENGGAILIPAGHPHLAPGTQGLSRYLAVVLGLPRRLLVRALGEIAKEAGVRVRGFSSLSLDEVQRLTGLPLEAASRARDREYDEPFLIEGGPSDEARLAHAADARGLQVTRGGRFLHLCAPGGKGPAVQRLLSLYAKGGRRPYVVALGDAANDQTLLSVADRPILCLRPDGTPDPTLAARFPSAERSPYPGPAGWNAAVLAVLR